MPGRTRARERGVLVLVDGMYKGRAFGRCVRVDVKASLACGFFVIML